jgi:serine/threonine protein kinase
MRADLAAFLAETAPKTDAARLVEFLRPLYADEIAAERRERPGMIAAAKGMLSGAIASPDQAAAVAAQAATVSRPASSPSGPSGHRPGEDPRIGTTLGGRYYVRRLCGEGAMGRVYEAHHIDIGRRVAIKVLHASFLTSADLVERFRREARAASKIGHANIVDVTDSGTTPEGAFYFVMEYLDGTNLEELIDSNGPLGVERALLITAQITRALEAAHAAEVIHRDLKPANVMLISRKEEDDFVKVLDFGISKDLDIAGTDRRVALTRPDVAIGTPVYMSPEQAAGRPADALTDVYAVGGLLYEMLTGCPPCAGTDAIDVLHKKAHEDPVPVASLRPGLPAEVERLVTRALSRAARDRHPSMTAFKNAVLASLGVIDRAATGPTPVPPVAKSQKATSTARVGRRPIARSAIWVAGGAIAVGIFGATWLVQSSSTRDSKPVAAAAESPPAAPEPASPSPRPDPPVAAVPRPTSAVLDSDSTPWPEREATPAAGKRSATRVNTAMPALPSLRRDLSQRIAARAAANPGELRGGGPLGPVARAPGTGHVSGAALAEAESAGKSPAALPAPRGSGAAPSSAEAGALPILERGQAAFDRGDYPEALRRGREAIAAGGALGGHLLAGDAYYRLERLPDALREYQAALALDPGNTSIKRRRDLVEQAAPR